MAQSIYGGRVDNEFDQRLLNTFLERLFTTRSFDSEFKLACKVDGHKDIQMPDGIRCVSSPPPRGRDRGTGHFQPRERNRHAVVPGERSSCSGWSCSPTHRRLPGWACPTTPRRFSSPRRVGTLARWPAGHSSSIHPRGGRETLGPGRACSAASILGHRLGSEYVGSGNCI